MGKDKSAQVDLESYLDNLARQPSAQSNYLDAKGRELPDPTPMAPPVGYKKQSSMVEIVREMVRGERLKQEAEAAGMESFEDSEDFDVGDDADQDPGSPWENEYDPPISEVRRAVDEDKKSKAKSGGVGAPAPTDSPKAPEAPSSAPEAPPAKPKAD